MPRYRIIKKIPEVIAYRNGALYFQDYYAGGKDWIWHVRRETTSSRAVHLCSAEGADKLAEIRERGLSVERGSTADAILDSLVRKGYAERVAE